MKCEVRTLRLTPHALRITFYAPRTTHHAPRITASWTPNGAVETIRFTAGGRIENKHRWSAQGVCADGNPMGKVRGGFNHVRHARQSALGAAILDLDADAEIGGGGAAARPAPANRTRRAWRSARQSAARSGPPSLFQSAGTWKSRQICPNMPSDYRTITVVTRPGKTFFHGNIERGCN